MGKVLGMNEALILSALHCGDAMSVADVAGRIAAEGDLGRLIDDGSIYLALHRMSQRGLVSASKRVVTSADGKQREINVYTICAEGRRAATQVRHEARIAARLSGATT
jgi:DNA-binding PadR family transcriptional regulator